MTFPATAAPVPHPRRWHAGALALALAAALGSSAAWAAISPTERAALTDLYNSADGAHWRNNANWMGAAGTECTWAGVTCDAAQSHVTALRLNFNSLKGSVPATLGNLTALTALNLRQNELSGPIPPLAAMKELVSLDLGSNTFSGPIPSLAGLGKLETFEVQGGELTGGTPALTGLAKLRVFNVSGNRLDGQIGPMAGAAALEEFNANINQLTGAIPDLSALAALRLFTATNNRLTSITALAGLANLDSFIVSSNQLGGAIPPLTGLARLRSFHVEYNQLSGPLPALTGLANLENFYVHDNQLTGQIPSLDGLAKLRFLHIQNNQLVGSPPMPPNGTLSAVMCKNPLRNSPDAAINQAWDAAVTGNGPWADGCTGSWDVTPTVRDARTGAPITDGSTGIVSPGTVQILPAGATVQFTMTPAPGYHLFTTFSRTCPGTLSGNVFTAGPLTGNCAIDPVFVKDAAGPQDGMCGSDDGQVLSTPPTNLCSVGTPGVLSGSGPWSWSCAGTGGGATAQCSAQKAGGQGGQGWLVTAVVNGPGGTAAPTTQTVSSGARASITAAPQPSYMLVGASGCGATFAGNAVTTAAVTAACTVELSFAVGEATATRFLSVLPAAPRVGEDVVARVAVEVGDTPLASASVAISGGGAACTAQLDAAGTGQCTLRFPAAGQHTLTALYAGDVARRYLPSSATHTLSVAAAAGGVQSVPTLAEWSLALLAALTGLMAARHLRRP